jgi:hypothetical protein
LARAKWAAIVVLCMAKAGLSLAFSHYQTGVIRHGRQWHGIHHRATGPVSTSEHAFGLRNDAGIATREAFESEIY